MKVNDKHLDLMRNCCAWQKGYHRNSYVSGPECTNWTELNELVDNGYMNKEPSRFGMSNFKLTQKGFKLLEKEMKHEQYPGND